jgi:dipeptidyl aminopeptidase/acylaminoacyl peptidase
MRQVWAAAMLAAIGATTVAAQVAPPPALPAPAAATPAAAGRDAPIPVEAFAKLPALDSPSLSPDGTRIAAKMAIGDRQFLVIQSLTGKVKPAVMQAGKNDVNWWRWVGNDWLAVGVGATQLLEGEEYYITRTLGLSADFKTMKRLGWDEAGIRADEVIWSATDGTPRILLAQQTGIERIEQIYPSVFEYDLSSGKRHRVVTGMANVFDWYADAAGAVRMGWRYSDDQRQGTLLYRPGGEGAFRTIAVQRRGDRDGVVVPLVFRADGSAVAIDDADGRDAVYDLSLPDLKTGKRLFGLDGYDVDGVVRNAAGNDIDGFRLTDHWGRTEWINPTLRTVQAHMDKAVGDRRARIVSWNADRSRLLVEVGGASQAGGLFYFDTAQGNMVRIGWNNDALKGRTLSPVSTIRYTARDGKPIEAILTLPRGRAAKALPLIVLPHGGPFARDAEEWDWWTQYLAESGYAVIQPNYRGSSGYGTAFARAGEGQWGLAMQDDLDDAAAHLVKQGIADPKRMCMIGASYGGYAAMRAAQRGDGYRCAVSYAGVSDLESMRRYDSRFLLSKTRADWLKKQAPDFRSVSPRFGAASFTVPILLVHGVEDKRVPVKQSRLMAAALKAAGKPYEYLEQPLADHHFSRGEDRLEFLTRMKAFLDRYNPA